MMVFTEQFTLWRTRLLARNTDIRYCIVLITEVPATLMGLDAIGVSAHPLLPVMLDICMFLTPVTGRYSRLLALHIQAQTRGQMLLTVDSWECSRFCAVSKYTHRGIRAFIPVTICINRALPLLRLPCLVRDPDIIDCMPRVRLEHFNFIGSEGTRLLINQF